MCGRYDNRIAASKVAEYFDLRLDLSEKYEVGHNVCPTHTVPVITNAAPDRITFARWGLIPFWAKDDKIGAKMINARGETVAQKPSFRSALAKRRCLIPAQAFYEWRKDVSGKTPLRFSLASGDIFAFAGLWETWKPPGSETPLTSCTIITTTANELVEQAHDRMPVILPRDAEREWLNSELPMEAAVSFLSPYPAEKMSFAEVDSKLLATRAT